MASQDPQASNSEPEKAYILAGQPVGWAGMAKDVREFDQEEVRRGKEDVDTLLVFAGLFSAVLASFLVAVYPNLQPSPMDMMNHTLERIANQTASYNFTDGRFIAANPSTTAYSFRASPEDIRVNALWFASLVISLATASFGILVKQWLDDYLAIGIPAPRARLRLRHFREPQIRGWKVYEIAACLPLLLHISLGLFFVGLCYFTSTIHATIGRTTLPLVVGWAICLFTATALPFFFPRCPYKIPLVKTPMARLHLFISHFAKQRRSRTWKSYVFKPLYSITVCAKSRAIGGLIAIQKTFSLNNLEKVTRAYNAIMEALEHIPNEQHLMTDSKSDLQIFVAADAIQANDELLGSAVEEALRSVDIDLKDAVSFATEVLANRVPTLTESESIIREWPFRDPFPFDVVRAQVKENILKVLYRHAEVKQTQYHRNSQPILDPSPRGRILDLHEDERTVLCALTLVILNVTDSREAMLPPNVIGLLRWYVDHVDGPAVCRDILYLTAWHCEDEWSLWNNAARLLAALAKLATPLELTWDGGISCFKSIQCLKVADSQEWLDTKLPLVWNYPNDFGDWQHWDFPTNAPDSLRYATLEYLFVLISKENSAHGEPQEVVQCALDKFVLISDRRADFPDSVLQAFVDMSVESRGLMNLIMDALVPVDVAKAQVELSDELEARWSSSALYDIQKQGSDIKPSNVTPEQSVAIWSSAMNKQLSKTDIDIDHLLSLCHIAVFLLLAINMQSKELDSDSLPGLIFSSIATWIHSLVAQEHDAVAAGVLELDAESKRTRERLAYGCLYLVDYEYSGAGYYDWCAAFSRAGGKTAFPDDLIEALGRFVPSSEEGRLYRLSHLKERNAIHSETHPGVAPLDAEGNQAQHTEQTQSRTDAAADCDESDSAAPGVQGVTISSTDVEDESARGTGNGKDEGEQQPKNEGTQSGEA